MAEVVGYVKWAGRTEGGQEKRGTRLFSKPGRQGGEAKEKGA